jgi:tetratricopeptide (TPR) repeat protein
VNPGRLWIAAGLAALAVAFGCTSALKEPPPVIEIGAGAQPSDLQSADPDALISRAELEFARRPDAAAVRRSQALYLEAARVDVAPVEAFLGAARATSWLVEHEENGERRKSLAVEGVQVGQWCVRLYPSVAECTFRLALAVGQQARERPSTAVDGLDVMVELLDEVIAAAPELDFAGGHRVLALVLLRAPAWPTGPGDPETGLIHALAAVGSFPDYPPNQLALAEALLENGRREQSRQAYQRAAALAETSRDAGEPEAAEWLAEAEKALAEIG